MPPVSLPPLAIVDNTFWLAEKAPGGVLDTHSFLAMGTENPQGRIDKKRLGTVHFVSESTGVISFYIDRAAKNNSNQAAKNSRKQPK